MVDKPWKITDGSWRPTIGVDFDGVIHAYRRGWEDGVIYDEPTEGCVEALTELSKDFDLVVFTARDELLPVKVWLREKLPEIRFKDVTNRKPKAQFYIDDRAIRFRPTPPGHVTPSIRVTAADGPFGWEEVLEDIGAHVKRAQGGRL